MAWEDIRARIGERCFVCEVIAGNPEFAHHVVHEDERSIAFLNRYPPLYGYVLVAPRAHREQVTGDFSEDEYVALQRVVHAALDRPDVLDLTDQEFGDLAARLRAEISR